MEKILVVDDEKGVCHSFKKVLSKQGYDVITALSGEEALKKLENEMPAIVIMDVMMPGIDGLETLLRLKAMHPNLPVIMMTAYSTSDRAITATKYGAYDYISKPFHNNQMISLVEKAIMAGKMSMPVTFENPPLPPFVKGGLGGIIGERIVGKSLRMLEIYKKIGQVSVTDVTVLLRGETGTGKELIARAIYHHSRRVDKPFLPVNCASIPETLLESELFGHEKGSFTGAESRKIGKFEQCNNGTMFLDEIGDMPLTLQAKLLRVLEDGSFQRLGGNEFINTDVRIIAATNKNLDNMVKKGDLREDLYWRLNVVTIHIPPLRERKEDIKDLVRYFIQKFNRELGKDIKGISPELLNAFEKYNWPGNIRELQNTIQRAMVLCQKDFISVDGCEWLSAVSVSGKAIDIEDMFYSIADAFLKSGDSDIYKKALSSFEHLLIKKTLELTKNNQALAARLLGISRNTLREKMNKVKS
ncbi:MAG: sigma-54-dependent Fis family transcriptional regulator [Nitrospirae bacterium]|nr:sigma-54-dependent Fis family transcriptional regulator [Nitrospirota bacterium]